MGVGLRGRALALTVAVTMLAALGGGPAQAATQRKRAAAVPGKPLQAFLLTGAPDSLADLRAHRGSVKTIYPTYFDCAIPGGRLVGRDNPQITGYARERHLTLMPRFNCQDGATVHRILTDPVTRAQTFASLRALAAKVVYGGLNLDLENDGAADREALSSFVADLAAWLHRHGKKLTVDVVGVTADEPRRSTGFYDDRALSAVADTIFVMAWGSHWAGSVAGPIGALSFVDAVAAYVASLPNARRFVLGVPMYGLDWPAGGGPEHPATAYQYSGIVSLIHSLGATPVRDPVSDEMGFSYELEGVAHQVWYLDARAILDRMRVARAHGLAVGLWRLGREDQALWSSAGVAR